MIQETRDEKVKKERTGDAWALRGEEGRDKLRKAAGRSKYPLIRGCPNGGTRYAGGIPPLKRGPTQGTETSKYLQEEKTTVIPQVAASERGGAQTGAVEAVPGLKDCGVALALVRRTAWKGRPEGVKAAYPKASAGLAGS